MPFCRMNSSGFFKKSASNWSVRAKFVFKSWAKTMLSFWWLCSFLRKICRSGDLVVGQYRTITSVCENPPQVLGIEELFGRDPSL